MRVLLLLSLMLVACGGSPEEEATYQPGDLCLEDQEVCTSESSMLTCIDNLFVERKCDYGCAEIEGEVVCRRVETSSCSFYDDPSFCSSGAVWSCLDSRWVVEEECEFDCVDAACTEE